MNKHYKKISNIGPNTKMPSANTNLQSALPNNREYELLVIPPPSPKSPTQPALRTKRISCNQTNGSFFWIPEGYRPVLVRTSDLPLIVGSEYNPPSPSNSSGYTSGDESGY
ncbi:12282_t:CDS:2 [Funneliformis geosporum]|nr:12282_t:CDS:2 [Funneliformis geosporum]